MKVIAFDQSTRVTGFSIFVDGQYFRSGVINLAKIKDTEERSREMGIAICKEISLNQPDVVIIEDIQNQSNISTVILLARLQGVILGYCAAHNIRCEIIGPSRWRATLHFVQGPKVKREELKQQGIDYVKNHLGFDDFTEDQCEACCLNMA